MSQHAGGDCSAARFQPWRSRARQQTIGYYLRNDPEGSERTCTSCDGTVLAQGFVPLITMKVAYIMSAVEFRINGNSSGREICAWQASLERKRRRAHLRTGGRNEGVGGAKRRL